MFNLFKKKPEGPQLIDEVWRTTANLHDALYRAWEKDKSLLFLFWFEDRAREAETFFVQRTTEAVNICLTRDHVSAKYPGATIIVIGHYPLPEKENAFYATLHMDEIRIWSSLDEPLFMHFGGQKIIALLDSLGMDPNEMIRHSMLTKAIHGAQEKIAAKVTIEQSSTSASEWIRMNLGS